MIDEQMLALDFYMIIEPLIAIIAVGVFSLWVKALIEDIVAGVRWKMKPGFEPGDKCFLDGDAATIVSIGLRETIFEVSDTRGKVWRYVDNKRIPFLKLEKIITK